MKDYKVDFKVDTFPYSDIFQIFRVYDDVIWQIISVPAFNIDTGYSEYFDMVFDDPVTPNIICEILNYEEVKLNG